MPTNYANRDPGTPSALTVQEAAARLGYKDPKTIYRKLKRGTIYGYRADERGDWRIPVAELERIERGQRRTRTPSEQGNLRIDTHRQRVEVIHAELYPEYLERAFNSAPRTRFELHDLGIPVSVAANPVAPPLEGHLWLVTLAEPPEDAPRFWVDDRLEFRGPGALAGLLDGLPEPVPTASRWGLQTLYDPDEVVELIAFNEPEGGGDSDAGDKPTTGSKRSTKPGRAS